MENDEQLDKFLEIRDRVPGVAKCIVLDRDGLHGFTDDRVLFLDELCGIGRRAHDRDRDRFRREVEASRPGDIAILIYTSGTTGAPTPGSRKWECAAATSRSRSDCQASVRTLATRRPWRTMTPRANASSSRHGRR